jgi:hypothetical protein
MQKNVNGSSDGRKRRRRRREEEESGIMASNAVAAAVANCKDKIFMHELKAHGCYKQRNSCSREPK